MALIDYTQPFLDLNNFLRKTETKQGTFSKKTSARYIVMADRDF
jgi:hypothetical protein